MFALLCIERTNEVDKDEVVDQTFNVIVYSCLIAALFISAMARSTSFFIMCLRASVNLHNRIFYSLLRAPIHVFDSSPVGKPLKSWFKIGLVFPLFP